MLTVKNLSVGVQDQLLLQNISFECHPHSVTALIGRNGSGKSTLLQSLMGNPLYKVTVKALLYNNYELQNSAVHERSRQGFFLIAQQLPMIPGLKVSRLFKETFQAIHGAIHDHAGFNALCIELLGRIGLSSTFMDREIGVGFSGGERKRIEVALLLLLKPSMILLDELDSGLDLNATALIGKALQEYRASNSSVIIIMATHHDRLAQYLVPDQTIILDRGIAVTGTDSSSLNSLLTHGFNQIAC